MSKPKQIVPIWDNYAKEDLKRIYKFNKKYFSLEFAKKIRDEIYQRVGDIVFLEQWQKDDILGEPYRRVVIRHYKIVYRVVNKEKIYILMVFDTRRDPIEYKLKK
ncbi:type II toxin-antitoxin system RelE/ParE family toxin [Tenacibaculum agarivorans]|uniref:type II toxin-antitoxin system RelE/ParE family toxin n=1 Tax=Tenacibaculum agarivorans TaxID=1908389 RepID=UPI00094BAD71|nr:type II toxin-antitoxin system RelE/ParE family toxin [Tenacibaculum agarivorans]